MNQPKTTDLKGKKNYGYWAFIPLIVFLLLYLGGGIIFTIMGAESPFAKVPRHAALLVGVIIALFMNTKMKFDDKLEIFSKSAGDKGVLSMVMIFLLAGAFAGVAKGMGGVDSVVNLGLTIIPKQFIIAGIFIISCFISTAMGTSTGTITAMAPIAVGVAERTGALPELALAAALGGAMFGDNISVISDTTIAATKGVGAQMKDKFRMNILIALPAAVIAVIIYCFIGTSGSVDQNLTFNFLRIIPYLAVLITAVAGLNVYIVLIGGTFFAGIVGMMTGSMNPLTFIQSIATGMEGMFNVSIMALLIRGLIGLITEFGGIDKLVGGITKRVKSRRSAEYSIAALVSILDFALVNNTIAIIIAAPIAKEIGDDYKIAPKRTASLLDIFSCVVQVIAPHAGGMLLITSMAAISPIDVLRFSFYPLLLGIAAIITIQFGLMRTKEEKAAIAEEKKAKAAVK